MSKLLVITPCTRTHDAGTLDLLSTQLANASIDHHIETLPAGPPLGWGLATKVALYRDLCHRYKDHYSHLVIADAFDVTFYGSSAEDVIQRIPADHVLCAAEKNCYPDPSLADKIISHHPDRIPHSFFNGGLTASTPVNLMLWLDEIESHYKYLPHAVDQWLCNEWLAEGGSSLFEIDWQTKLFFCLFCGYPELDFVNGEPVNRTFDTWPLFCHANGGWNSSEMFSKYEESLK